MFYQNLAALFFIDKAIFIAHWFPLRVLVIVVINPVAQNITSSMSNISAINHIFIFLFSIH